MRAYRLLLHLYPSSFRAEYEDEMPLIFSLPPPGSSNAFALAILWVVTVADVLRNALSARPDVLRQDLRYTARTLLRSPEFALDAVLVAAVASGRPPPEPA